ncbi:Response regulator containing CheY-like receiver domain and AraC-type DNA-binding domain [Paenibacillus uliginis N3/975]|uniref:Response regulator containing CheY-like receiver domain and AraC-type DNA-binding domain n=1 Tax=Paenibacillus uliginis N3/975 TaxID=1313296 RepID=A0A1X7HEB2_9BACL|nr:Response regulator containing CheY-like receiver domain and AraC-type DNA-binding domain [Paenibacillus uliginis N3/975]
MSLRILIVDDTKFVRLMLTDILMKSGYEVVGQAENGVIAVDKFRELRPDLIIMDITMPEMDGITALKEIRAIDPKSVILICSAMSQRDLISKALKAGANNYVMKPFEPELVKEIILEVMPLIENNKKEQASILASAEPENVQELVLRVDQASQLHKIVAAETTIVPVTEQISEQDSLTEAVVEPIAASLPEPELELSIGALIEALIEPRLEVKEALGSETPDLAEQVDSVSEASLSQEAEEEFGSLLKGIKNAAPTLPTIDHERSNADLLEDITAAYTEAAASIIVEDETSIIMDSLTTDTAISTHRLDVKHDHIPEESNSGSTEEQQASAEEEASLDENIKEQTGTIHADESEADEQEASPSRSLNPADWFEQMIFSNSNKTEDAEMARNPQMLDSEVGQEHHMATIDQASSSSLLPELKRKNMRNFASSIMCKFSEQVDEKEMDYFVVYNEFDKSIRIDMISPDEKRNKIQLSLDGFTFIMEWLEQKGVRIDKVLD